MVLSSLHLIASQQSSETQRYSLIRRKNCACHRYPDTCGVYASLSTKCWPFRFSRNLVQVSRHRWEPLQKLTSRCAPWLATSADRRKSAVCITVTPISHWTLTGNLLRRQWRTALHKLYRSWGNMYHKQKPETTQDTQRRGDPYGEQHDGTKTCSF